MKIVFKSSFKKNLYISLLVIVFFYKIKMRNQYVEDCADDKIYKFTIDNYIQTVPEDERCSSQSSQVEKYKILMHLSHFEGLNQTQIMQLLLKDGIIYNPKHFQAELKINIEQYSTNYEAIKVNVKYGNFSTHFTIINLQKQSPFNQMQVQNIGSFGKIHKYSIKAVEFAIKSIKFRQSNFQKNFIGLIKEYLFLAIASSMKAGCKLMKLFGFDIVIFQDSLVFSMEYCKTGVYKPETNFRLTQKLHLLHLLRIVHMDIKPENMGFSQSFNDFIFIDFGLSRAIKQNIGFKSKTAFTGSINYCCNEMLQMFVNDDIGLVNLYYNDAYCLHKSLNEMKMEDHCFQLPLDLFDKNRHSIILPYEYILLLNTKCMLFSLSCEDILTFNLYDKMPVYVDYFNKNFSKLAKFYGHLPTSIYLESFSKYNLFEQQQIANVFNKKQLQEVENHSLMIDRYVAIQSGCNCIKEQSAYIDAIISHNSQELVHLSKIKLLKEPIYMLALIKLIRINSSNKNFKLKIDACRICNEAYSYTSKETSDLIFYKKTIGFIFETALKILRPQNPETLQILKKSIESVAILQAVPQSTFTDAYKKIMSMDIGLVQKMSAIFEFITSLQFIKQKYRKTYRYEILQQKFLSELNIYIKSHEKSIVNLNEQMVLNRLKLIIVTKMLIDEPSTWSFKQQQLDIKFPITPALKRLNESLTIYMYFLFMLALQTQQYINIPKQFVQWITICKKRTNNYFPSFSYINFFVIRFTGMINKNYLHNTIYQQFCQQFSHLQEFKYFNFYLSQKIEIMKSVISQRLSLTGINNSLNIQASDHMAIQFDQIFSILDYIVKNNPDFHTQLGFIVLKNPSLYLNSILHPYFATLISNNRQKITRLSNDYQQKGRETYETKFIHEIMVISNILYLFENTSSTGNRCLSNQRKRILKECQQVIQDSQYFYHKIQGKISILHICIEQLRFQEKHQQMFQLLIKFSALYLKNRELNPHSFDIIYNLLNLWISQQVLYQRYDLRMFLYDFIKSNKNNYYLLFYEMLNFNVLLEMHIYCSSNFDTQEVISFLKIVLDVLKEKCTVSAIHRLYFNMVYIIQYQATQQHLDFISLFHQPIIDLIVQSKQFQSNPYTSIYLYSLLQIRFRQDIEVKIFKNIGGMIDKVDPYSRSFILKQYYGYFAQYMSMSLRKKKYLKCFNLKLSAQKLTLKSIRKIRIMKRLNKFGNDQIKQKTIVKMIQHYYANLGNLQA